jgi:hypothetical protein
MIKSLKKILPGPVNNLPIDLCETPEGRGVKSRLVIDSIGAWDYNYLNQHGFYSPPFGSGVGCTGSEKDGLVLASTSSLAAEWFTEVGEI